MTLLAYRNGTRGGVTNRYYLKNRITQPSKGFVMRFVVEATRFERAPSASRTQRSTKLSHASIIKKLLNFSHPNRCKWSTDFLTKIFSHRKPRNPVLSNPIRGIQLRKALPRFYAPKESYKSPLRSEWLFIAVSAPHKILFGSLISVVSMCSKAVYGQLCGHTELLNNKE